MPQLPAEVWLHITGLLPDDTLTYLLGLNRLFFDIAMDIRYKNLELCDATPKVLSQLRLFPAIAKRVRSLRVHLDQLKFGTPSRARDPSTKTLRTRLRSILLYPLPRPRTKPLRISFEAYLNEMTAVLPTLENVEVFHVGSWNLPREYDLLGFFSAAWLGFGRTLRSLSIGGNIEGFAVIKASRPILPTIKELHFEFTDSMNTPRPDSLTPTRITKMLLHDFVAPFINGLNDQLEVLKLSSWASTDLSFFFKSLGSFPRLHTLCIWAAFNRSFSEDSSGLTEVLCRSSSLKELVLHLNPIGSRLSENETDLRLCQWLRETVHNNEQFSSGLRGLVIYPSTTDAGLDSLVTCIGRSAKTLERLNVRDRYLFPSEITKIAAAFHPYSNLMLLRLNVRKLPVQLFDLFAKSFPNLDTLSLRTADGEPTHEFVTEIQTRRYDDWKLYDITILQGGNELELETMLLLAKCIPSVRSFWGKQFR